MGIVAFCPNGHRIKVKDELAGRKGVCPTCAAKFRIPLKDASPAPDGTDGPPLARVVSLDPIFAGSLPAAYALDEAETVAAAPETGFGAPDFVLVAEDDRGDAGHGAATHGTSGGHAVLDERPELAWCFAIRGGAPSAPIDTATMRAWLDSGEATADHVVWRQDWPEWRPLPDVFPDALPPAVGGWP